MALSDFIKKRGGALTDVDEDKGGKKRELEGAWKYIITALCLSLAAFQLYAAGSGLVDDKYVVSVHLAVIILLIYLLFPATKHSSSKAPTVIDIILGLLSFCAALYVAVFAKKINAQMGIPTKMDLIFGVICLVLVLEATRRAIGMAMPIVACVFLLYAVFGRQIPGVFRHAGFTVSKIIKLLYLTDEGIFGTALNTSATYVVLFIFFGAIMSEIGMSKFLSNLALALAGGSVGGPAKVSALAQRPDGNSQRKHFCKCSNDGGNDDTFNEICWIRTGICRRGRVCGIGRRADYASGYGGGSISDGSIYWGAVQCNRLCSHYSGFSLLFVCMGLRGAARPQTGTEDTGKGSDSEAGINIQGLWTHGDPLNCSHLFLKC